MSTATDKTDKTDATVVEAQTPPPITELEAPHVAAFLDTFANGSKKRKDGKVKEEVKSETEKPTADAKVEPEKKVDATAKPKRAAKKAPETAAAPASTAPDYDKIAEASARGVAKAFKEDKPAPKPEEKPSLDFLSDEDKAELPVLEQMEASNPAKYKGLAKKFTDAIKAKQDYEAKWEAENPGKVFNAEDEEHNDFFAKNDVDWKDRDYTEALADLKVAKATKGLEEKQFAELAKLNARDKEREVAPLAVSEAKRNGKSLFDAIGGDFAKVLADGMNPNPETIAVLYKEDETRASIVFNAANELENIAAENLKLFTGVSRYDENNNIHKKLSDFALSHEQSMETLSREERLNAAGQEFAPAKDYSKMTKAERAKHWTFSARDLNDLLAAETVVKVKQSLEADEKRVDAIIAKRGLVKTDTKNGNGAAKVEAKPDVEEVEKPISPQGGDTALVSGAFRRVDIDKRGGVNGFMSRFLGK